jgi:hypothetical protein
MYLGSFAFVNGGYDIGYTFKLIGSISSVYSFLLP